MTFNNTDSREAFVNRMKMGLEVNNYGFRAVSDGHSADGWRDGDVKKIPAVRELLVRLNLFEVRGEYTKGYIDYPEIGKQIAYLFDPNAIGKSYIKIVAK